MNITKTSFGIIKEDKKLLLFPFFAGIFSIAFMVALFYPILLVNILADTYVEEWIYVVVSFAMFIGFTFFATFFNVCALYTVKQKLDQNEASLGDALKFAFSRIHRIFVWSLVAGTVGLILKYIDFASRALIRSRNVVTIICGFILRIFVFFLKVAWAILTLFVVPVLVYHDVGPFYAIRKSKQAFAKTWGENVVYPISSSC
ncbi:MAG: DUF6159 family protein [Candidatus Heimdallarchaeaceae archaeon]